MSGAQCRTLLLLESGWKSGVVEVATDGQLDVLARAAEDAVEARVAGAEALPDARLELLSRGGRPRFADRVLQKPVVPETLGNKGREVLNSSS